MIKIDGPLLGIPILIVLKKFMNDPHLHLIPELKGGPTRRNGNLVWFFCPEGFAILGFPLVQGHDHTLLGSG